MTTPFDRVGVEQIGRRLSLQYPVELPDQIGNIAQTLAHALPDEGRLLMSGIACDCHTAAAPLVGNESMEAIGCGPPEFPVSRR